MKIFRSKKGLEWFALARAIIILVVIVIVAVLFTSLAKGGAGKISDLLKGADTEINLGGTQTIDEACVSSWDCELNMACIDSKCQISVTDKFPVLGEQMCHHDYNGFYKDGILTGADCKKFLAGKYLLEISAGESGFIDKKGGGGKTQDISEYAETTLGAAIKLQDFGFIQPTSSVYLYKMRIGKIYKFESATDFDLCGWIKDGECSDNTGSVTIRVDKLYSEEELAKSKPIDCSDICTSDVGCYCKSGCVVAEGEHVDKGMSCGSICIDSDNGFKAAIEGTTTGLDHLTFAEVTKTDECGKEFGPVYLTEYYCDENTGEVASSTFSCRATTPEGSDKYYTSCIAGACAYGEIEQSGQIANNPQCTDSDNGFKLAIKGITEGYYRGGHDTSKKVGDYVTFSDYCIDGTLLMEFECQSSTIDSVAGDYVVSMRSDCSEHGGCKIEEGRCAS